MCCCLAGLTSIVSVESLVRAIRDLVKINFIKTREQHSANTQRISQARASPQQERHEPTSIIHIRQKNDNIT